MKKRNKPVPDIKPLLYEIEKWTNENRSGKSKMLFFEKQMHKLGMKQKKHFIPFKHRLLLKHHRMHKSNEFFIDYGEKKKR